VSSVAGGPAEAGLPSGLTQPGAVPPPARRHRRLHASQELGVAASMVVLFAIFAFIQPLFAEPSNIGNIARQATEPALLALGQGFAMIAGGFDLSIGGNQGLVSAVVAYAAIKFGTGPGMVLGVLLGALIGLANGVLIARYRLPPFIVTLGMASFCRGIAYLATGGLPVFNLPADFAYLGGTARIGPVPLATVIGLILFLLLYILLTRTKFGYHVYAIGGNEPAARLAGIAVVRTRTIVYVLSGTLAGLAGVMLSSRVNSGQPALGDGSELLSVAAVIIGGVRLRGGQGSLFGVLLGVLLLAELANGLNLINMPSYVQLVATGLIVMVASVGSVIRGRRDNAG
jgi:ribose transport system permease protein